MAIYKVVNESGRYRDINVFRDVISYITSEEKVSSDGVIGGAVQPETAEIAMENIVHKFHTEKGLKLRHSVLSFDPNEPISPRQAKEIARKCIKYYETDYQILAAVHEDKEHLHIHFVMNTTNYHTGQKYHGDKRDYYGFLSYMNRVTTPYRIRVKIGK